MSDEYTIFIDESGDEGLSGKSSQMFCLGAFIIKNDEYDEILNNLNNIKKVLKKQELHATHIKNHISKVFICKEIAKMPITAFGLISNKSSLGNYNIKEHWKYYNKNCQFLLELFGQYIEREFKHPISHTIIFEHKENAEYQKMKNLIYYAKYNSSRTWATKTLNYISENAIISKKKEEEPLLEIADFIAHALQRCCNHYDAELNITEDRYLRELKNKFYYWENGRILFAGIKPIHNLTQLGLLPEVSDFLDNLKHE